MPVATDSSRSTRWGWLRLGVLGLAIAGTLVTVTFASRAQPPPEKRPFDSRPLRRAQQKKPHVVVLGNSMAGTRIHEKTLDRLLAPRRSVVITMGGSRMGVWYLMLKNYVIASGAKPDRVIVFFRHTELTDLTLRPSMDRWQIDRTSPELDPVVERRLSPLPGHPVRRLSRKLGEEVPLQRLKELIDDPAGRFAYWTLARLVPGLQSETLPKLVNAPFRLRNLRAAAATAPDDEIPPVGAVVETSLLPPMIELANEYGIGLSFVRIRSQSVANGESESPQSRRYLRNLKAWIEQRGATLIDMTDATWVGPDLYGSGDHIAPRYQTHYTRLFVRNLPELFE